MTAPLRFDDALPAFADLVCAQWGIKAVVENHFLRDATGRLTFVVVDATHSVEKRAALAALAVQCLSPYVDANEFSVATPAELFDDSLALPEHWLNVWLLWRYLLLHLGKPRRPDHAPSAKVSFDADVAIFSVVAWRAPSPSDETGDQTPHDKGRFTASWAAVAIESTVNAIRAKCFGQRQYLSGKCTGS